jgi:regulator of protease activity HflC (stomatin/prohibitin superfamily)
LSKVKEGNNMILILILLILMFILIVRNIVIVPQGFVFVTELVGSYKATWKPGLHVKVPFLERIAKKVNVKEVVGDFAAIEAITKDNVMLQVDSVVFYKVREGADNPRKFAYGVTNPETAIELLTATTLRNIIGEMTLDEALTSRERINDSMRRTLDDATDDWGVLVRRVELKSLTPGKDVRIVMERQVTAERNKRAEILEAEGHKQADILKAEGHKEALILDAEADKQRKILEAEAEKQSQIERALGKAEAIRQVQKAEADGIRMLNEAGASSSVLQLKGLEALEKVADGNSTKLIVPSEMSGLANFVTTSGEFWKTSQETPKEKDESEKIPEKHLHNESTGEIVSFQNHIRGV